MFGEAEQFDGDNDIGGDDDVDDDGDIAMMSKTYLKWVRKAKQFDDKEGKVFQFGRGD